MPDLLPIASVELSGENTIEIPFSVDTNGGLLGCCTFHIYAVPVLPRVAIHFPSGEKIGDLIPESELISIS